MGDYHREDFDWESYDAPRYEDICNEWEPDAVLKEGWADGYDYLKYFTIKWEPSSDEVLMLGPYGLEWWQLLGETRFPPSAWAQFTVSVGAKTYWAMFSRAY